MDTTLASGATPEFNALHWFLVTPEHGASVRVVDGLMLEMNPLGELVATVRHSDRAVLRLHRDTAAGSLWIYLCHGDWQLTSPVGPVLGPREIREPTVLRFGGWSAILTPDLTEKLQADALELFLKRTGPEAVEPPKFVLIDDGSEYERTTGRSTLAVQPAIQVASGPVRDVAAELELALQSGVSDIADESESTGTVARVMSLAAAPGAHRTSGPGFAERLAPEPVETPVLRAERPPRLAAESRQTTGRVQGKRPRTSGRYAAAVIESRPGTAWLDAALLLVFFAGLLISVSAHTPVSERDGDLIVGTSPDSFLEAIDELVRTKESLDPVTQSFAETAYRVAGKPDRLRDSLRPESEETHPTDVPESETRSRP